MRRSRGFRPTTCATSVLHRAYYETEPYTQLLLKIAVRPELRAWGTYKDPVGTADVFRAGVPLALSQVLKHLREFNLAVVCFAVSAIALGRALQINNGFYSQDALWWLTVALCLPAPSAS